MFNQYEPNKATPGNICNSFQLSPSPKKKSEGQDLEQPLMGNSSTFERSQLPDDLSKCSADQPYRTRERFPSNDLSILGIWKCKPEVSESLRGQNEVIERDILASSWGCDPVKYGYTNNNDQTFELVYYEGSLDAISEPLPEQENENSRKSSHQNQGASPLLNQSIRSLFDHEFPETLVGQEQKEKPIQNQPLEPLIGHNENCIVPMNFAPPKSFFQESETKGCLSDLDIGEQHDNFRKTSEYKSKASIKHNEDSIEDQEFFYSESLPNPSRDHYLSFNEFSLTKEDVDSMINQELNLTAVSVTRESQTTEDYPDNEASTALINQAHENLKNEKIPKNRSKKVKKLSQFDAKDFDFIVRTVEKMLEDAFTLRKDKSKGSHHEALDKYLEDYQRLSPELPQDFMEAGRMIYDAINKLKQSLPEEGLEQKLSSCQTDIPMSSLVNNVKLFVAKTKQDLNQMSKSSEQKEQYTYANFKNCMLPLEMIRRIIILKIAQKFVITENMETEFREMKGDHGIFILSVLEGKRNSIESKIRLLQFSCNSTKHIIKKTTEIEEYLMNKLQNYREDLDEILKASGLKDSKGSDLCFFGETTDVEQLTRVASDASTLYEQGAIQTKQNKPLVKRKQTLGSKQRALRENAEKCFNFVRDIEENHVMVKREMEEQVKAATGFLFKYWPYLFEKIGKEQKKAAREQDRKFTEAEVEYLLRQVEQCFNLLNSKFNQAKDRLATLKSNTKERKSLMAPNEKRFSTDFSEQSELDQGVRNSNKKLKCNEHFDKLREDRL